MADRAFDVWEPLLAIADLAGGEWPQRARAAAVALCARSTSEDESIGVRLLSDLHDVFELQGLRSDLGPQTCSPRWSPTRKRPGTSGKQGKPLSARSLAGLLRRHHIRSRTIRIGDETAKGFLAEQFEEAWKRYLPPGRASIRHRRHNRHGCWGCGRFRSVTRRGV